MDIQSITNLFNNYGGVFISATLGSIIGSFLGAKIALHCRRKRNKPSRFTKIKKWLTYKIDVVN